MEISADFCSGHSPCHFNDCDVAKLSFAEQTRITANTNIWMASLMPYFCAVHLEVGATFDIFRKFAAWTGSSIRARGYRAFRGEFVKIAPETIVDALTFAAGRMLPPT
jgi:hypothetical protein